MKTWVAKGTDEVKDKESCESFLFLRTALLLATAKYLPNTFCSDV